MITFGYDLGVFLHLAFAAQITLWCATASQTLKGDFGKVLEL